MGAAPVLDILLDGETIKSCPIEGEVLLGRMPGCVIRLEDRAISRRHAVFRQVAGGVQVEKRSEFAPLMVNGTECTSALVKEGDVISIGPYLLRLAADKAAREETSGRAPQATAPLAIAPLPEEISATEALAPALGEISQPSVESLPPLPAEAGAPPEAAITLAPSTVTSDSGSAAEASAPGSALSLVPAEGAALSIESSGVAELIEDDARTKVAAPEKLAVKLLFKEGDANVTEFELNQDEISIGRGKDCDVVLLDKKSSRRNSLIRRAGLNFVIKDLGSANGTYVNGARVEEQELASEDVVQVGDVEFRFKAMSADYLAREEKFLKVVEEEDRTSAAADFDLPFPEAQNGELELAGAPQGMSPMEVLAAHDAGAAPQPDFGAAGAPIPGIPGMGGAVGVTGPQSNSIIGKLLARYRAMPKRQQFVWTVILICLAAFLILGDEEFLNEGKRSGQQQGKPKTAAEKAGAATFQSLTPEQRKFIESQHVLAFDFYKARDYDKALFELDKIFALVPDYKDSREIERYAREGKRKLEAMQEEKRRKEEEARLKAKVAQLEEEGRNLMAKKQYEQLQEIIGQILAHDPENANVAKWREELEQREEARRASEQQREVQQEVNREGWTLYRRGLDFKRKSKFKSAIATFQRVLEIGATDARLNRLAKKMWRASVASLRAVRDPVLAEAREAETAGEFVKAFGLFLRATKIDPSHPDGFAGMDRIRGILHEKAKHLYTEAVLAESYSDFDTARRKFEECLVTAPPEDIYRDRAARKLARYLRKPEPHP
ncbi:MAG: FHA domain-containing protein [Oligoflexia bacterium]|nr:FHA domain-containing protein [Oligoflexia bacterium]